MSEKILENLIRQMMEQGGQQVSFGWQGGEPTLMGIDFYKKAFEFQKKYGRSGQVCGNGLQTNGLLIDDAWSVFLHDSRFLVGLSLDGPDHIHDRYRKDRAGNGTWEKVVKARDTMLRHEVEVNALVVVNDYSVQFPEEIYNFHKNNSLNYMQFVPCMETDPGNPLNQTSCSVNPDVYGDFLITLFKRWYQDFINDLPTTFIRWFDSLFYTYAGFPAPECTLVPECGIYTVVEHNGDVYACDFFVEPEWRLGNLENNRLVDLLNSDKQRAFGRIKRQLPEECESCRWLSHCYAGCPKDRQNGRMPAGSNPFCRSFQQFFEYADPILNAMAFKWHERERRKTVLQHIQQSGIEVRRNDLCPCGSGKKFKHCCGRNL